MTPTDRGPAVADGRGSAVAAVLFTAYVWAVSVLTLAPLWVVLAILPRGRRADRLLKFWARTELWLSGCRLQVRGLEHIRRCEPAVLVVNHSSYLDAVVLMAALPVNYRFVANHHAAGWPLVGLAIRKADHLVVDRTRLADRHACALAMIETLRQGISVLVFPEGTIDREGRLLPFQPGAFRVAVEGGRPVVPVILRGTRDVLSDGLWRVRRSALDVCIYPPIEVTEKGRREVIRVRDEARHEIVRGLSEAFL